MASWSRSRPLLGPAIRPIIESLEERALLSASATLSADGTLAILGTEADDRIIVQPAKHASDELRVTLNGVDQRFALSSVKHITVDAGDGDDVVRLFGIHAGGRLTVPATILGGAGNDTLTGGAGPDEIHGGDGNDSLLGAQGDDSLFGEAGKDYLIGNAGTDDLFGGDGKDLILTGKDEHDFVQSSGGQDTITEGSQAMFPIVTYTDLPTGYRPDQIRSAYGFPDLLNSNAKLQGQGQTIVIVDAFHSPTAKSDLAKFSRQFNLPGPSSKNFQQVQVGKSSLGSVPVDPDGGWTGEAALDVQWAHAIAPKAKIVLVEARSNAASDLLAAVQRGAEILSKAKGHGGVISLSLGGTEIQDNTPWEAVLDPETNPIMKNISVMVSSGDDYAGVNYPATSPHVTAIGGTTLYIDPYGNRVTGTTDDAPGDTVNGGITPPPPDIDNWQFHIDCLNPGMNDESGIADQYGVSGGEAHWFESGALGGPGGSGGYSTEFPAPLYQQVRGITLGRGSVDFSWNADPRTGVSVYDSFGSGGFSGWSTVGGTSAGAPQAAAMVSLVNQLRAEQGKGKNGKKPIGSSLNQRIYALGGRGRDAYFNDITVDGCGQGTLPPEADGGWDSLTGFGSPNARSLVPALADVPQKKNNLINTKIQLTGQVTQRVFTTGTTGTPSNSPIFDRAFFKGTTKIAGYNTLTMQAFRMSYFDFRQGGTTGGTGAGGGTGGGTGSTTSTVTIDVFGMDPIDGQPNPPDYDATNGNILTAPGSPIILSRFGNTITGSGFYLITINTTNGGGGGTAATYRYFQLKFVGNVSSNGKDIEGDFFVIDPSTGKQIKSAFAPDLNGLYGPNELGIPVVNGRFDND